MLIICMYIQSYYTTSLLSLSVSEVFLTSSSSNTACPLSLRCTFVLVRLLDLRLLLLFPGECITGYCSSLIAYNIVVSHSQTENYYFLEFMWQLQVEKEHYSYHFLSTFF